MQINGVDVGYYVTEAGSKSVGLIGTTHVEGAVTIPWHRGGAPKTRTETIYIEAQVAVGGYAAFTPQAAEILLTQLQEMSRNSRMNPVFIQWRASSKNANLPGGVTNAVGPQDGWWLLEDVTPDTTNRWSSTIKAQITATFMAPGPPNIMAMGYSGGTLTTSYTVPSGALPSIGYPINTGDRQGNNLSIPGSEGNVAASLNFATTALAPFTPSATPSDWFKGGCRVYDTVLPGGSSMDSTNAVPTNGAAINSNWIEVRSPDHVFQGDCIITNTLLMFRIQPGTSLMFNAYLWSTAQATPGWLKAVIGQQIDYAGYAGVARSFTVQRVGPDEVRVAVQYMSANVTFHSFTYRLQWAKYFLRMDYTPQTNSLSNDNVMVIQGGVSGQKHIVFDTGAAKDSTLSAEQAVVHTTTDYGYGAAFTPTAATPYLYGVMYLNAPYSQIYCGVSSFTVRDTVAYNAVRSYGMFITPYGTNGATTPLLWSEGESSTATGAWTAVADAGASGSGNNSAKLASGTVAGSTLLIGSVINPATAGPLYDLWFRVRVTSAASATPEMTLGIRDTTAGITFASTTFAPNQAATTYGWIRSNTNPAGPSAGHNHQLWATNTGTLATDWFIDEVAWVPRNTGTNNTFPQDIYQMFVSDLDQRLVTF